MNRFLVEKTSETLKCDKGNQEPNKREMPMDGGEIVVLPEGIEAIEHSGQSQSWFC